MVPAGLNIAETMETGDIKNHGMTGATNVFFRNRLVHDFYHLKVLITSEQVSTSEVKKKKSVNNEQNFNQWCRW